MIRKIQSALFLSFVLCCGMAQAQQVATRQSVEELLVLMHTQDSINEMVSSLTLLTQKGVARQFKDVILSKKGQKIADKIPAKIKVQIADEIQWSKVKEDYITQYQATFTQKEIDAQLEFYKTPVGNQVLLKSGALSKNVLSNLNKRISPILSSISNIVKTEIERAKLAN